VDDPAGLTSGSEGIRRLLVCGATGYIGGRLVPRLLDAGYVVRCFVRSPQKLDVHPWRNHPSLEVVRGELSEPGAIEAAAAGCQAGYYLVHSMISAGKAYSEQDRLLAANFARAADLAHWHRIIYLGGLGELGGNLSEHLRSRRDVEEVLRGGAIPLTAFRAAMIIGSGSASFEILRYLVERLPVMVTPRWVQTPTQPIAVRDCLRYLVECLGEPATAGRTIDIGGSDVMSYMQIMRRMAEALRLPRRWIFPVPVLTPRLSSLWIGLVTPVDSRIARPLAEGLRNPTVCRDAAARQLLPGPLMSVAEAIAAAVQRQQSGEIETRWSSAGRLPGDPDWAGGTLYQDRRDLEVDATSAQTFQVICRIGGEHGYWGSDWLWHLRGWMDKLVGGPGLRRGRRHPQQLGFGEVVDFWRVTELTPGRCLRLGAEMKLPGEAELEFRVEPIQENRCRVTQTARFRPRGLAGIAYWYAVSPLHYFVFQSMLRGIARESRQEPPSEADRPR
jgi:uncharacterized protein YbjT (DUF2867 family)